MGIISLPPSTVNACVLGLIYYLYLRLFNAEIKT